MKTEIGYKYNLELELLTPVSIGDGSTLSPLSDFSVFYQNGKRIGKKLDKPKFEEALSDYPEAISDYLQKVRTATDNKKENKGGFLPEFIKEYLKDEKIDLFFKENTIEIIGEGNSTQLNSCIKERGIPFIPGSTLKGAIKTALFYNWLQEEPQQLVLENICFRLSRKEKVDKETTQLINTFFEKIGDKKRMSFSLLRVSDAYLKSDRTVWVHCDRFRTRNDSGKSIPSFKEAIRKGEKASFELFIEDNQTASLTKPIFQPLNRSGIDYIREAVNKFSLANLQYEIHSTTNKSLSSFTSFLSELLGRINTEKTRTMFIPIGSGKSNFYQSIGLAVWEKAEALNRQEVFHQFLKAYKIGRKPNQKHLPLTRNLISATQEPLGWVCIYPQGDEMVQKIDYSEIELKDGQIIQARVIHIATPHSEIQIAGREGILSMTGTKKALTFSGFKENCLVNVRITLNKQGKIAQTSFVKLI
jgi:CRISPR-associated protein Csm5